MRDEAALDAFAREHGLDRDDAERAVSDGLERAIDDAEEAGALPGSCAPRSRGERSTAFLRGSCSKRSSG